MSVNLGSRDIGMAQHGLDTTQVGAVHKQVSRKAVPQCMRRHVLGYARQFGVAANQPLDTARC